MAEVTDMAAQMRAMLNCYARASSLIQQIVESLEAMEAEREYHWAQDLVWNVEDSWEDFEKAALEVIESLPSQHQ